MRRQSFWNHRFTRTRIKSEKVQLPEMLFGYILGPMGASISGSIFGSILQSYFTDVLRLDLRFLSRLQLVSTVLIVAANLLVGQLIERTRATAGKARPWLLLSVFTFSSASVLMFIVPFQGIARMVWIAVAYNLYYSFASPIYGTASSIMLSVSTRDSRQRGLLASINSMVGLGVMGTCSMVFPMLVSFFPPGKYPPLVLHHAGGGGVHRAYHLLAVCLYPGARYRGAPHSGRSVRAGR